MSRETERRIEIGAFLLVAATALLLVVGASVRVNGAGLACPDWPLCFGEVIPPLDVQVGFEFGHRVLAGCISLGFLALGAMVFRARQGAAATRVWFVAAALLATQIVLGGLTVLQKLAEWTVASHLLTGNAFCATLLVLALTLRARRVGHVDPPVPTWARAAVGVLAVAVPTQLFLGGWVAGANAGLVCAAVPGCYTPDGAWFPTFSGLVGLQVTHRLVALCLWGAAVGFALAAPRPLRSGARLVAAAVTLQACVGVANVALRLPVEVTLAHSAGAALVALSTTFTAFRAFTAPGVAHSLEPIPAVTR